MEDIGFLKLKEVLKIIPVSRSSWYAGIEAGLYPKPLKLLMGHASGWSIKSIKELVKRIEEQELS